MLVGPCGHVDVYQKGVGDHRMGKGIMGQPKITVEYFNNWCAFDHTSWCRARGSTYGNRIPPSACPEYKANVNTKVLAIFN